MEQKHITEQKKYKKRKFNELQDFIDYFFRFITCEQSRELSDLYYGNDGLCTA